MRHYATDKYIELVENIPDERFQNYIQKEIDFIAHTPSSHSRTFVDLGAGYGRVLDDLSRISFNVLAIEINEDLYNELEKRARNYRSVTPIYGDILNLDKLLQGQELHAPVFLLLQNTLGPIEGGYERTLEVVVKEARKQQASLILSILHQSVFKDWGLHFYKLIEDMAGEVDLEKTDVNKGVFVSKTGYVSKWWTDEEIEGFKQLGHLEDELVEPEFHILRLSF